MLELIRLEEGPRGRKVAVGEFPRLREVGVVNIGHVLQELLLMVSPERDDAPAVALLEPHDGFENPQRVGSPVAVVAEEDKHGILGLKVDGLQSLKKWLKASMDIRHAVNSHTSAPSGLASGRGRPLVKDRVPPFQTKRSPQREQFQYRRSSGKPRTPKTQESVTRCPHHSKRYPVSKRIRFLPKYSHICRIYIQPGGARRDRATCAAVISAVKLA